MRLKGGKVFLDLTSYGDVYINAGITDVSLSDEELKAILEKGLIYKILYNGVIVCNEFVFTNIDIGENVYTLIQTLSEEWLYVYLRIYTKTLSITEI